MYAVALRGLRNHTVIIILRSAFMLHAYCTCEAVCTYANAGKISLYQFIAGFIETALFDMWTVELIPTKLLQVKSDGRVNKAVLNIRLHSRVRRRPLVSHALFSSPIPGHYG